MRRSCAGSSPSREKSPCTAAEAAFRGGPESASSTRPSISAAFSPAGPPPAITTSYTLTAFSFTTFPFVHAAPSGHPPEQRTASAAQLATSDQ